MATININKRRRTGVDIVDVSAYLSKPSRAILAVAFTSFSWHLANWIKDDLHRRQSPISKAFISASQWDILDFEDTERKLVNKLTDNDINAILKCINAKYTLKKIKLCGCVKITGIGLNPLRGSVVLEQIDLSLIEKHDNPNNDLKSEISEESIVAVLNSIISADGCSLKHITFPPEWRGGNAYSESESLNQFRQRYNILYDRRRLNCSKCNAEISNIEWMTSGSRMFHNNVCYDCLKPFCDDCTDEGGDEVNKVLKFCGRCDKDLCVDCVPRTECTNSDCDNNMCSGCAERSHCQQCNETKCGGCLNTCNGCNGILCGGCTSFYRCSGCEREYCVDCQISKDYDGGCEECKSPNPKKSTK